MTGLAPIMRTKNSIEIYLVKPLTTNNFQCFLVETVVKRCYCMTLKGYRVNLGWSINQLAKAAGVARQSVVSAEAGEIITAATAKAIADALTSKRGEI